MRLGLAPSGRRHAGDAVVLARVAEDHGFDELWVSEDYLERGAFAVAGAMAAVTSRTTIGLGVINPWTRALGLTAMECAALDEIAEGRLVVGLGASNERWMNQLGIGFDRPIGVLREFSDGLRILLNGGRLSGEVLGAQVDMALHFTPRRDIPIFWGVKGERALTLGAAHSDGLMLSVLSSPGYVRWVRETRAPRTVTAYARFAVDDDPGAARESVRENVAQFLGIHGASPITAHAGIDQEVAAQLRERLLSGRSGVDLVDDAMIAAVTVSGSVDDCARQMRALYDAGVDTLVVTDDGSRDPQQLAADVIRCAQRAGLR